jgi:integrase
MTITSTLDATSREEGETKSARGKRTIDMPPQLVAELTAHRARMKAERDIDQLVFPDTTGGSLRESNFARRSWKPLLIRTWGGRREKRPTEKNPDRIVTVPVRDFRLYDLRHTAATLMIAAGVHVKVISERMGHASVAFTMDRYGHLLPTLGRDAASAIGAVFDGGRIGLHEGTNGAPVVPIKKQKTPP